MQLVVKVVVLCCYFYCFNTFCIENSPIILGTSNALTGPAAQLGIQLNQGANIYFDKINNSGGIFGHHVKLISLDDSYEPYKTVKNTQELLKIDDLFALFNYVGTPTSHAILSIINQKSIPYLMPFTGAEFLRNPINKNIYNLRASYYQEAEVQIDYLIEKVKAKRIGLLIQADEFGLAVESGYLKAMKSRDIKPAVTTRFRRNTEDVLLALSILEENKVDAVAFVGTYKPLAELINTGYEKNFAPYYTTVSFVSSYDLFSRIKYPSRLLVTEVMPDLNSCKLKICKEFILDNQNENRASINPVVFEGYINAKVFVEVALLCKYKLTRQCFLDKIAEFKKNIGGIKVSYTTDKHQGLNEVYFNHFSLEQ